MFVERGRYLAIDDKPVMSCTDCRRTPSMQQNWSHVHKQRYVIWSVRVAMLLQWQNRMLSAASALASSLQIM